MRCVKYLVPVMLALVCSYALTAEDTEKHGKGGIHGALSAAPAGSDAKVLGVLTTKSKDAGEQTLNVIAANDEVAATIKGLVAKSAKVSVKGEKSADGKSITVSEIKEYTGGKHGDKAAK